jgi:hypothetical protein
MLERQRWLAANCRWCDPCHFKADPFVRVKVAGPRVCHRNVRILSSFVHGDQAGERIPRISFSEEKRVFQDLYRFRCSTHGLEQFPPG